MKLRTLEQQQQHQQQQTCDPLSELEKHQPPENQIDHHQHSDSIQEDAHDQEEKGSDDDNDDGDDDDVCPVCQRVIDLHTDAELDHCIALEEVQVSPAAVAFQIQTTSTQRHKNLPTLTPTQVVVLSTDRAKQRIVSPYEDTGRPRSNSSSSARHSNAKTISTLVEEKIPPSKHAWSHNHLNSHHHHHHDDEKTKTARAKAKTLKLLETSPYVPRTQTMTTTISMPPTQAALGKKEERCTLLQTESIPREYPSPSLVKSETQTRALGNNARDIGLKISVYSYRYEYFTCMNIISVEVFVYMRPSCRLCLRIDMFLHYVFNLYFCDSFVH